MLLYDNDISGNCYKVRLLFAQLGIDYERRHMSVFDRSDRQEVLGGLNPGVRVPTLVLDDGRTLAESNAIIWYFGEPACYVPDDPYERAQMLQWLFFEENADYRHPARRPVQAPQRRRSRCHPEPEPQRGRTAPDRGSRASQRTR